MRFRNVAVMLAAGTTMIAAQAFADDDLMMSKHDATVLTDSDVGKPYWRMEAQCAGMMGAAYAYDTDHHLGNEADTSKSDGIAMLNEAIARLQMDRGIDQPAALNLAAVEVETGRAAAKIELDRHGTGPESSFNLMRSACYDISAADRRHPNH